ncbi:MAG: glycine--tRNA ligase [Candidatus Kuenenbacteria bacterium]
MSQQKNPTLMEKIESLSKRRGFIFQSSEIYGGFGSNYDYGPLGVELANNIKKAWWQSMVQERFDVEGIDSAIIMHPKIWQASGHIESFTDPLVDCKKCKRRFRADHLLESASIKPDPEGKREPPKDIKDIVCPECGGDLTDPRNFNLLMKTSIGAVENETADAYLRGETCQGIYVNFKNVIDSTHQKIPFGIAQIGKAFRNEITPGNYIFRTREFEQMEMQYFVNPKDANNHFKYWKEARMKWYQDLGIRKDFLRWRQHGKDEMAHYAQEAWDIEFNSPFGGWKELAGVHNRGDWDLTRHQEFSGADLTCLDPKTKERFHPYIIETSDGVGRAMLAFLINAYDEIDARSGDDKSKHKKEIVLRLHKRLAPIKIAVLPLSKKEKLQKLAKDIGRKLSLSYMTRYDETGSIGKRYRRQDEIGTPYCVTVDFDSLEDRKVTVRDRDTMRQERIEIVRVENYFKEKF